MNQIGFLWNGVDKMKRVKKLILLFTGLLMILGIFIWYEHFYDMHETTKWIPTTKGRLAAVLTQPKGRESRGIVVLVHGDAAVDATNEGGYRPMMEQFAKAGFTTISWAKPGVTGSAGNWLNQSMDDRADEVTEVIQWARKQPTINTEKIVLWGISQGGWVVPKVAAQKKVPLSKIILVSPAIDWLTQNTYYTTQKLKREGKTPQQITEALGKEAQVITLLKNNVSFQEYLANTPESEPMSKERWSFVKKNFRGNSRADLEKIDVPVELILADHDQNVDIKDTEKTYSEKIPTDLLSVYKMKNAAHSMVYANLAQSEFLTTAAYLLAPKDFLINRAFLRQSFLSVARD